MDDKETNTDEQLTTTSDLGMGQAEDAEPSTPAEYSEPTDPTEGKVKKSEKPEVE